MSSLAAARADNFYFPTDFDPKKHKSLNGYHGSHGALGARANKLHSEGILVIRFEMPFNVFCTKCNEMIAKGERFNADKKHVDNYYSTRVWEFSMRHHCGCTIVIRTDPKAAEYRIMDGARVKVEEFNAKDMGALELPDTQHRTAMETDPLYRLEHAGTAAQRARSGAEALAMLHDTVDARTADPYTANRLARASLRQAKRADAAAAAEARALGVPEGLPLLPAEAGDAEEARWALRAGGEVRASNSLAAQRAAILAQPIFVSSGSSAMHGAHVERAHAGPSRVEGMLVAGGEQLAPGGPGGVARARPAAAGPPTVRPYSFKGRKDNGLGKGVKVGAVSKPPGGHGRQVLQKAAELMKRRKAPAGLL